MAKEEPQNEPALVAQLLARVEALSEEVKFLYTRMHGIEQRLGADATGMVELKGRVDLLWRARRA